MCFDKLRDEIVESQKARTDLIKWKVVLVAAIGASAAGIQSDSGRPTPLLLAVIPFVCLYVDAVCFHNDIRIVAIAKFFRTNPESVVPREIVVYEEFCKRYRATFNLESVALQGATLTLSFLVLLLGCNVKDAVIADWFKGTPEAAARVGTLLIVSGALGIAFGWFFYRLYKHKMDTLDGLTGWPPANWARRRFLKKRAAEDCPPPTSADRAAPARAGGSNPS